MATHVLGLLAFWKLGEHFQFARALMSTSDKALSDGGHFLMDDSSLFTVLTQYDINEAMYEKARKYRQEKSTLLLTTELQGIGKSSVHMKTIIQDPQTRELLGSLQFKYVKVALSTRRSVQIPEWFLNKYDRFNPGRLTPTFDPAVMPNEKGIYRKIYTVLPSDIDSNNHMNNNVYLRLCFDAATEASVMEKMFSSLHGDMCNYLVKSASCVYEKECRLGDVVDIFVWEDKSKVKTLHCKIIKGSDTSFQCTLLFHSSTRFDNFLKSRL